MTRCATLSGRLLPMAGQPCAIIAIPAVCSVATRALLLSIKDMGSRALHAGRPFESCASQGAAPTCVLNASVLRCESTSEHMGAGDERRSGPHRSGLIGSSALVGRMPRVQGSDDHMLPNAQGRQTCGIRARATQDGLAVDGVSERATPTRVSEV